MGTKKTRTEAIAPSVFRSLEGAPKCEPEVRVDFAPVKALCLDLLVERYQVFLMYFWASIATAATMMIPLMMYCQYMSIPIKVIP